jgi:membrane associated rhomboid family serine protease
VPPAQVRYASETLLMPPAELEEELRRGRLPDSVHVQHPEWTGEGFAPAREIAALRAVLASDEARMCARLRRPTMTWVTASLCLVMGLVGIGQGIAAVLGLNDSVLDFSAVGFEHTVLDGAWWSPLTAAFTHIGFGHLGVNLPLLAYCGYRTERVLGPWGVAAVLTGALLGSTIGIVLWSDLPVVGASTLAYGVWGAQIAIGFRFGPLLPPELQSRYGIGNLVLFLPLAFMSLFDGPGVSLVGHAGGLMGGAIAAGLCSPLAPNRARTLTAAAFALTAILPFTPPQIWAGLSDPAHVSEQATITLPSRWAEHTGRFEGMHAWSSGDRYPVFAGTFVANGEGDTSATERERTLWGEWLRGDATATAEGDAVRIVVDNPEEPWVIVERVIEHDGLRTRAGYLLPPACSPPGTCSGRRAMGDAAIASLALTAGP